MIGIANVSEIGPVITVLICAGKIGSGIGAELASMKVTEQIDDTKLCSLGQITKALFEVGGQYRRNM